MLSVVKVAWLLAANGLVVNDVVNAAVDAQCEAREEDEGLNTMIVEGATASH